MSNDNGTVRSSSPRTAEDVLAHLRQPTQNRLLLRGFGPLVLAVALVLVMILLAPSIAPERVVERPVESDATTDEAGSG